LIEDFLSKDHLFLDTKKNPPFDNPIKNMLMFQDAIEWPDPDSNDEFYSLRKSAYRFNNWSDYLSNGFNMRSPKFKKTNSILTSGCSHSWGVGLKDHLTWSNLVAENYGLGYSNVSLPGSSVMAQVMNIFQYCKTFGNPRVILCMFPNFERTRVFVENNIIEGSTVSPGYKFGVADAFTNSTIKKQKIIKLPADKDILVSENHAFYNSLCFIMMLEQYCASNSIGLYWSTWSHEEYDIPFNHIFNNYVNGSAGLNAEKISDCNKHKKLKHTFNKIYDEAADGPGGHFGVHWHNHVAELFINQINNNSLLS
jgi:hypothetical protein